MTNNEKQTLANVGNMLNQLNLTGYQNWDIVIACLNEIDKLLKGEQNGNIHDKPES